MALRADSAKLLALLSSFELGKESLSSIKKP